MNVIFAILFWLSSLLAGGPQVKDSRDSVCFDGAPPKTVLLPGQHRVKKPDTVIALEDTHFKPNK